MRSKAGPQESGQEGETQSAGRDPVPGAEQVDTSARAQTDLNLAVDTLGDLPDFGDLELFEVPPEGWPRVEHRAVKLHEKKRISGIIRGGDRRAQACLAMSADGWLLVEDVVNYLICFGYFLDPDTSVNVESDTMMTPRTPGFPLSGSAIWARLRPGLETLARAFNARREFARSSSEPSRMS